MVLEGRKGKKKKSTSLWFQLEESSEKEIESNTQHWTE